MHREQLDNADSAWIELLGSGRVLGPDQAHRCYAASTIGVRRTLAGALIVESEETLPAIVNIARRFAIPLYPISTGKNWGYGSALPPVDHCVVVDLSRLDKILSFDEQAGVVTVQPGVTQGMLSEYLTSRGLPFLVPVTGAGPGCSIVGNALERGYGITPHTDHFASLLSLTAVLADGSVYRSPLSELGGVKVDHGFKWGVGPYADGLFTQGNFGIVTRLSIALARRPAAVESFFFRLTADADLEPMVNIVRDVVTELGGNLGAINLMNDRRMLAMVEAYPTANEPAGGIIPDRTVSEIAGRHGISSWTGTGALYGNPTVIKAVKAVLKRKVAPVARNFVFLNRRKIGIARRLLALTPKDLRARFGRSLETLGKAYDVLDGIPNEVALPLAYWRSGGINDPGSQVLNPASDGCGLIWYAPLVPMEAQAVRQLTTLVREICEAYSIEPLITLTSLNNRCFDCTVPILFDGASAEQAASAGECYRALVEKGMENGFVPYRLNVESMQYMGEKMPNYWGFIGRLKHAVDPLGILAPGRYGPLCDNQEFVGET